MKREVVTSVVEVVSGVAFVAAALMVSVALGLAVFGACGLVFSWRSSR